MTPYLTPIPGAKTRVACALATAALTVAVLVAALTVAAGAQAATKFSITGRGYGHGIGMSQYGAYGYARHGWKYKAILKHYYAGIGFGKTANRKVRIRLCSGVSAVTISATSGFKASSYGRTVSIPAGTTRVTWSSGKYRVAHGATHWLFSQAVAFMPGAARLRLSNPNEIGYVGRYRGSLRVIHQSGGFLVVNKLPLEGYLYGVVPKEVSPTWPVESVKALASAARAFAARSAGTGSLYDLNSGTSSQAYGGADSEAAGSTRAVNATKGVVPVYDGRPIIAMYFSTSGGHTESIQNVWDVPPTPYLKGVSDPYDGYSPYHVWPRVRQGSGELGAKLGSYSKGALRAIYVVTRGVSPRIKRALVIGDNGVSVVSGADLRARLGLRDTWVYFASMSIASSAGTIDSGASVRLTGRRYPALAAGATVTVHFHPVGGGWGKKEVKTTRHSRGLAGYRVYSSRYVYIAKPQRTTEYYITSAGGGTSPHVTVTVRATAAAAPPSPAATP